MQHTRDGLAGTVGEVTHQDNGQHMGKHVLHVARWGTLGRCAGAKENGVVHGVEIEMGPKSQEEDKETLSINSLYLNRKWSLIMANLEMQAGETALEIPYKIDTGSEGNLMPLYIF